MAEKWTNYKAHQKLVNPANKRKLDIIVVGTGLAGASAAASLGEMGFHVINFRTPPAARTPSPLRVASMQPRTTRTMATPSTVCSTTPSRAATTAPVRPTSTAWPR